MGAGSEGRILTMAEIAVGGRINKMGENIGRYGLLDDGRKRIYTISDVTD